MEKSKVKAVTSKMVPVAKEDMRVGNTVLVVNDHGMVSEQVFRGRVKSENGFLEWSEKSQDFEWVKVEGDASYMSYLESMKYLFKHKRLLKYKL